MNTNEMDLFNKSQEILKRITGEFGISYAEMSEWQLSFLCGMLKNNNPKKIAEIGVSAGGTTAVIMETLRLMDSNAKLYSVDYSVDFYRNNAKKTGFVAEWVKKRIAKRI